MARSLAAQTREAAREHPFLVTALAAGVVNYAACARFLGIDGDPEAVATALARYADELSLHTDRRRVTVNMHRNVGTGPQNGDGDGGGQNPKGESLLRVGDLAVYGTGGDGTAVIASGDIDAATLGTVLRKLEISGIKPLTAGVGSETLVIVLRAGDGPDGLRAIESALERVPSIAE